MSGINDAPPAKKPMCAGLGMPALRIMGFLSGSTVIALGVYSIAENGASIGNIVNNLYRIIFGILIILAELRLSGLLKWFSFLTFFAGLGAFYVFVGGLACGSDWYEIALAVLLCCIGFVYMFSACACSQFDQESQAKIAADQEAARAADHSYQPPTPAAAPADPFAKRYNEMEDGQARRAGMAASPFGDSEGDGYGDRGYGARQQAPPNKSQAARGAYGAPDDDSNPFAQAKPRTSAYGN